MQKLYAYVDETGQDTAGRCFIVSVVVVQKDRRELNHLLEAIEGETGKKKAKWIQTKRTLKVAYVERVFTDPHFQHKIFYSLSTGTKAYKEATLATIASSITAVTTEESYKASIFIDGLSKRDIPQVGSSLRKRGIRTEKIRGVKDENEALIRLADAIAGVVRENYEGIGYAQQLYQIGIANQTLLHVAQ